MPKFLEATLASRPLWPRGFNITDFHRHRRHSFCCFNRKCYKHDQRETMKLCGQEGKICQLFHVFTDCEVLVYWSLSD